MGEADWALLRAWWTLPTSLFANMTTEQLFAALLGAFTMEGSSKALAALAWTGVSAFQDTIARFITAEAGKVALWRISALDGILVPARHLLSHGSSAARSESVFLLRGLQFKAIF